MVCSTKEEIYLLIAALGVGALFVVPLVALQAAVPLSDMATATAALGLIRTIGGTCGISIGGAIYASEVSQRLRNIVGYTPVASTMTGDVSALSKIEVSPRGAGLRRDEENADLDPNHCSPLHSEMRCCMPILVQSTPSGS